MHSVPCFLCATCNLDVKARWTSASPSSKWPCDVLNNGIERIFSNFRKAACQSKTVCSNSAVQIEIFAFRLFACSVIFEKQLVNRKLSAVHSAVQVEIFAFRLLLNRRYCLNLTVIMTMASSTWIEVKSTLLSAYTQKAQPKMHRNLQCQILKLYTCHERHVLDS